MLPAFTLRRALAPDAALRGETGEVVVADAAAALFFRGSLPGAFGFDQAAFILRAQIESGAHPLDLLPLAFPTSWMVNSKASSLVFQRYMMPDAMAAWEVIAAHFHYAGPGWAALGTAGRRAVSEAVSKLTALPGSSLASVSKILALLFSGHLPIIADSELWFITSAIAEPTKADGESGSAAHFPAVMDWYEHEQAEAVADLRALAAGHQLAPLEPRQVLDRLVWYAAWGHRVDPQNQRK